MIECILLGARIVIDQGGKSLRDGSDLEINTTTEIQTDRHLHHRLSRERVRSRESVGIEIQCRFYANLLSLCLRGRRCAPTGQLPRYHAGSPADYFRWEPPRMFHALPSRFSSSVPITSAQPLSRPSTRYTKGGGTSLLQLMFSAGRINYLAVDGGR